MCLREMKAAIVLTFLVSVGLVVANDCPAPSTILPCSCEARGPYAVASCPDVTDFASIKKMLAGKFDRKFKLDLTNLTEKTFERGAAQEISSVFYIYIVDSLMLESLANDSLRDMSQLRWVEIIDTSIASIPTAALATLSHLRRFTCAMSRIPRLLKKDLHGISKKLEILNLSDNPISSIEEGALAGFSRLRSLDLSGCNLKTLPAGHWLPSHSIIVYLGSNKFDAISMENFSGLGNSDIDFNNNEIRQLPNGTELVKFFDRHNSLDLRSNPLQCGCDLKWILDYEYLLLSDSLFMGRCRGGELKTKKYLKELTAADFSDCNSTTL